jgi:thiol:disulfide interchange protein DsbC
MSTTKTNLLGAVLAASLVTMGASLLPSLCLAAPKAADVDAALRKVFATTYPNVTIVDVRPGPVEGLYEVFTGDTIVYANATGSLLMLGPLVDTATRSNLTAQRIDDRNSIDFSTLPLNLAIKTVKGDGRHTLAVFSDPDCPFCKQLEQSIHTFDNVTIYTFLFPITSLHPDAANKARNLWCSADRTQAWQQWMIDAKAAPAATESCKQDPINELQALGNKLRVASTPTLFFANGQRVAGTLTAEQLKQKFDAVEGTRQASTSIDAGARPSH